MKTSFSYTVKNLYFFIFSYVRSGWRYQINAAPAPLFSLDSNDTTTVLIFPYDRYFGRWLSLPLFESRFYILLKRPLVKNCKLLVSEHQFSFKNVNVVLVGLGGDPGHQSGQGGQHQQVGPAHRQPVPHQLCHQGTGTCWMVRLSNSSNLLCTGSAILLFCVRPFLTKTT